MPPFMRALDAEQLAHRGAGAGADAALRRRLVAGGLAGGDSRPRRRGGCTASPIHRSNSTAAGTIGTRAGPTCRPWPRSSSQRITPPAASRPKALPPVSSSACTCSTRLSRAQQVGLARAGRGAAHVDAADRALRAQHARCSRWGGGVSVKWPTRRPATSVIAPVKQLRIDAGHANTPAVSRMRALTSPRWCIVSPKLSSMTVRRLK